MMTQPEIVCFFFLKLWSLILIERKMFLLMMFILSFHHICIMEITVNLQR